MTNDTITLSVNGDSLTCSPQTPVVELLKELNYNPRLVAVEYNGEILHRQHWSDTVVKEGDQLEIVTIVGGGYGKN